MVEDGLCDKPCDIRMLLNNPKVAWILEWMLMLEKIPNVECS